MNVAMPPSFGADIYEREMGYLSRWYLEEVGVSLLPDLSGITDAGELCCGGLLVPGPELWIDLPDPSILRDAVDRFFQVTSGAHRGQARESIRLTTVLGKYGPWAERQPDRRHTTFSSETLEALAELDEARGPYRPPAELLLETMLEGDSRRSLQLRDGLGDPVGKVYCGFLVLEDERNRSAVLEELGRLGVPVTAPAEPRVPPPFPDDPRWPRSAAPNLVMVWRPKAFFIGPPKMRRSDGPPAHASYNPTTRTLWVEDSRLVAPALRYANRVGLRVDEVGLPSVPWQLDTVPFWQREDAALVAAQLVSDEPSIFQQAVRETVPPHLLKELSPGPACWHGPDEVFLVHELHVPQRRALFGDHRATGRITRCRLCSRRCAEFSATISNSPLAYCQICLSASSRGIIRDRTNAAEAVRHIGQLEFDGVPMLEAQLASLHVDPARPVGGGVIDRMLVLRWSIPRGVYAWTHLLEAAGFASAGLRLSRGTLIRARDGHLCQSLSEKAVCDFLHQHDISHDREPAYPHDPHLNPHASRRADWKLADGTFIEFWGLPNQSNYALKMSEKRSLARQHSIPLIELLESDLQQLPSKFSQWLPTDSTQGTTWKWSPARPSKDLPPN